MAVDHGKQLLGNQFPAPFKVPQYMPLWCGRGTQAVGFYLIGQRILWFNTHWDEGRVVPCIASFARCRLCKLGWTFRPRGFIPAMRAGTGGTYLLTVTQHVLSSCPALAIAGAPLYGLAVIVRRRSEKRTSAWVWELSQLPKPANLPPAPDVFKAVERLWGIDLRRLNAHPPADGDVCTHLHPFKTHKRG